MTEKATSSDLYVSPEVTRLIRRQSWELREAFMNFMYDNPEIDTDALTEEQAVELESYLSNLKQHHYQELGRLGILSHEYDQGI